MLVSKGAGLIEPAPCILVIWVAVCLKNRQSSLAFFIYYGNKWKEMVCLMLNIYYLKERGWDCEIVYMSINEERRVIPT